MPPITPDDQTVSNTHPAYYDQGVSTPPNGADVSTVSPSVADDTTSDSEQPSQFPQQLTVSTPQSAPQSAGTVSNTAPTSAAPNNANHPVVQKAGILHDIAQTLAGGPRFKTVIDPNSGETSRIQVPLSNRQISMAIALSALSGGLAGMSARGTNSVGQAGALGLQQGQQIAAQRDAQQQQEDQQAQEGFRNQQTTLAQKASIAEANSRTILNTAEAESRGADAIQKLADQNKQLIDDYESAGVLHQRHVTQQELMDGMKSGKFNVTEVLGPIDGYRLDENGRAEATHAVITDPTAKVPLTTEQWNSFADAGVPGWQHVSGIPDGFTVTGSQLANANEQKNALTLAQARHDEVADALSQSDDPNVKALAEQVPTIKSLHSDPKTGAGLVTALQHYQKYVSHSDLSHGMDLYDSLRTMAQPSRPDGKGGLESNPDSKYAGMVARAYGGWNVLQAYHNEIEPLEIKNAGQAADMIASSEPGSRSYKYAQRWMRTYGQQQAQVAAARAAAEARVKQAASTSNNTDSVLTTPDALGFTPSVPGGLKEYNKRQDSFKKQADELAKTEATVQQFNDALNAIKSGNFTGAQSVVSLFDAIGLSATPLAGKGFRVNQNTIAEHAHTRGLEGALQQKLLQAKAGDIITPQQVQDYAQIAAQARQSQYVNLVNEAHNAGISANPFLPTGNGQKIDPATVRIFLTLADGDKQKARAAAQQKGWVF